MGNLRFLTAGESHGQCLTAIVEGIPAGLKIDIDEMNRDMARRQQGYGRGGRMKIETDQVEILSGIRFGETMGDPVTLRVTNRDWQNWTDRMSVMGQPSGEKVTAARRFASSFCRPVGSVWHPRLRILAVLLWMQRKSTGTASDGRFLN